MYAFYEYFSKFVFFCFVCFCPKDTQRLFCWCPEESLNRLALSRCSILPAYIITPRLRELECLDMWDWVFPPKQKTTMSTKHCAIRRWPPFTRIELRHFAAELLYCSLRTIQTTTKMMWDLNLAPRFKKRNTTLNDEKRKRNTKHSSIREKKKGFDQNKKIGLNSSCKEKGGAAWRNWDVGNSIERCDRVEFPSSSTSTWIFYIRYNVYKTYVYFYCISAWQSKNVNSFIFLKCGTLWSFSRHTFWLLVSYENSHFRFRQTLQGSGRNLFRFYFIILVFFMFEFLFLPHRDNFGGDWETTHKSVSIPEGGGRRICNSSKKTWPPCLSQMFSIIERFSADFFQSAKKFSKGSRRSVKDVLKPTQTFS